MRFRVLGPLEVLAGDEWQTIGARKWRSLLATLLLNAGRTVSVDSLTDAVWGDEPPAKAANLVSIYVLRLRRLIGDPEGRVLVTRSPGYFIRIETGDLDAAFFEDLVADGRKALAADDPASAAAVLREALALWRGEALADVPPSAYLESEAERLGELWLAAAELRIEADLKCGRHAQVIPELRGMLSGNQLRERLWLLLIRALDGDGRRAEALEAYAQAREAIADQLGVDPGAELRRLHQDLLASDTLPDADIATPGTRPRSQPSRTRQETSRQGGRRQPESTDGDRIQPGRRQGERRQAAPAGTAQADQEPGAKPAAIPEEPVRPIGSVTLGSVPASVAGWREQRPPVPSPAQLPTDIGDFTGRSDVVDHLFSLLSADYGESPGAVPVVVVAGSGGLGKTSLAIHASHRLRSEYPDGQLYVDLLGATPHPQSPADVLARFLRDLGVESGQVPVTEEERAALYRTRLAGRRILLLLDNARDAAQVRPLLPGSSTCAVIVTARSRMPDLASTQLVDLEVLDDEESLTLFTKIVGEKRAAIESEATAEVMIACAGLPLAIRICAARLAARSRWSIRTLAERLRDRLLDELRTGDMAVRASFQVSFDSLPTSGDPARTFRLLGLWQGPFISLAAAAALLDRPAAEAEEALEILVDAYLLESPAPDLYRFHDLLRIYAAERAAEEESKDERQVATHRVVTWYLHTVDAGVQIIAPHRTPTELSTPPVGVRPLEFGSADAALDWCERERSNLVAATRQAAENGWDDVAWQLPAAATPFFNRRGYGGDWIVMHELALRSVRKLGHLGGEAVILNNLGMAHQDLDMDTAIGYFEQALSIRREIGDLRGEAQTVVNLDDTNLRWGRYSEVVALHEQTVAVLRRAGDRNGEGLELNNIGEAYLGLALPAEALQRLSEAEEILRETGDDRGLGWVLQNLGAAQLVLGQPDEGIDSLRRAVRIHQSVRERRGEAAALTHLGRACGQRERHAEALDCLTRARQIFVELGDAAQAARVRDELAVFGGSGQAKLHVG
jgi:DNA-binding SARP family transcriptional activator